MSTVKFTPSGFHAITPYLAVKDAAAAIQFYQHAFGALEMGRISMPNGAVGHAELQIGDSRIMLAEEMPEWGNKSPATLGGSPVDLAMSDEKLKPLVLRHIEELSIIGTPAMRARGRRMLSGLG